MKTKLIILTLINMVYTQDVTLTFDCPEEVTAGSEGNHLFIEMENFITLAAMELSIEVQPNNITFHNSEWIVGHFYVLNDVYDEDSLYVLLPWAGGIGDNYPPGNTTVLDLTFNADNQMGDVLISFSNVISSNILGNEVEDIDFSDTCTIAITEPLPDVYLGFGELDNENQTVEFIMNNSVDVASIQFSLTGITVGSNIYELGGSAMDNGFLTWTNENLIFMALIGVGGIIPPSEGPLAYFSIETSDSAEACIIDPILTDYQAIELTVEIGPCISTGPNCPTAFSSNFEEFNDINGDGSLNISDIVIIVNCIFEAETTYDCQCGDIDEDGETNIIDIVYLVNILLMEN